MAEIGCLARLRSRVFAHGYHPVSETGALLIMQRGPPSRSAQWRGKQWPAELKPGRAKAGRPGRFCPSEFWV